MKIIETNWKWNSSMSTHGSTDYIALHHAEPLMVEKRKQNYRTLIL